VLANTEKHKTTKNDVSETFQKLLKNKTNQPITDFGHDIVANQFKTVSNQKLIQIYSQLKMYLNKLKLLNKVKEVVVCVKGQIHFNEV
jgi:formate dehydrogenase maturation protein FdhE